MELGLTVVLKPIFAHVLMSEKTSPMVPVWLAVMEPASTME
jgi:hypothetical protein